MSSEPKPAAAHATSADGSETRSVEASQVDDNYELYRQGRGAAGDADEAAAVLRKVDRRLMPVLFVTYMLQYLDKNSINFASVYGLQAGTGLVGQDYSWLGSIFYFGYLLAQYPAGYYLQRLPTAKVLGWSTVAWGAVLLTTPGCTSFAGIAVNRFVLGAVEAIVNPGFVLMMSIWYTAAEQPLRLEIWYCTNGVATMFGGLIGYAVGHITTGLPQWMYVFLIFGAVSVAWGAVSLAVLPDLPSTAKFLNERERAVAVGRVAANRAGVKSHVFRRYQAVQALTDPKTWILFVMAVGAQIPNAAITSFTSIIIESFGFSALDTQYLQIPGGFVQFAALLGGGWVCSRFPRGSRCPTMFVANSICIVGSALLLALPQDNRWGRLVALWLCFFQGLGFSMSLTMVSSNVAGWTKKQVTGAILFAGYCVGNIIGPQTFKSSEKPFYRSAFIAMLVGYSVKLLMVVVLYVHMYLSNRRRDREAALAAPVAWAGQASDDKGLEAGARELEAAAVEAGMRDETELDNKGFRYIL